MVLKAAANRAFMLVFSRTVKTLVPPGFAVS